MHAGPHDRRAWSGDSSGTIAPGVRSGGVRVNNAGLRAVKRKVKWGKAADSMPCLKSCQQIRETSLNTTFSLSCTKEKETSAPLRKNSLSLEFRRAGF